MLFNSYVFLFFFLPIVVAIYALSPKRFRNVIVTIASFAFYAYWDAKFCILLAFSILINYYVGSKIFHAMEKPLKKKYLFAAVAINLSLLGYFKYAGFFLSSFQSMFPGLDVVTLSIVLPIGISFYTFQGMSYAFDIYNGNSRPVEKFADFACYISMFPQLIAGPIVRYDQIAIQLHDRTHSVEKTAYGIRRFIVGLSKKVLVADTMAYISDIYLHTGSGDGMSVWIGIIAFSLQIYFDFSGYSDMAIGLGSLFGFRFPENFSKPYSARGIFDFWRRWHMTLSGWLRDYLYIPLGGSRCSTGKWIMNIMITFLLCGLWHGASWTFVAWGGYYGLLIILERPFRSYINSASKWVIIPLTNLFVTIGWVFFKAETIDESLLWLGKMFDLSTIFAGQVVEWWHIAILGTVLAGCWSGKFGTKGMLRGSKSFDAVIVVLFLACFVSIMGVQASPFLYFQF